MEIEKTVGQYTDRYLFYKWYLNEDVPWYGEKWEFSGEQVQRGVVILPGVTIPGGDAGPAVRED